MNLKPGQDVSSDRFRTVEIATAFKRLNCHNCDLVSVYKYRVKQVRRSAELIALEDQQPRQDEIQAWSSIPRFAEIPETIKCKRCGEVLGLYTSCIF